MRLKSSHPNTSDLSAYIRLLKEQTAPRTTYSCYACSKWPETYSPLVVTSLLGPLHSNRCNDFWKYAVSLKSSDPDRGLRATIWRNPQYSGSLVSKYAGLGICNTSLLLSWLIDVMAEVRCALPWLRCESKTECPALCLLGWNLFGW